MNKAVTGRSQPYIIDNLQGMNQRQPPNKTPDNYSSLLFNISNDRPGNWGKRKGSQILGKVITPSNSGNFANVFEFNGYDGDVVIRFPSGNIQSYDLASDQWAPQTETSDVGVVTPPFIPSDISGVTFNNKLFYTSHDGSFLKIIDIEHGYYVSPGTVQDPAGAHIDDIRARRLVVSQSTLYAADVVIYNSVANTYTIYADRVYYSIFDATNGVPSGIMSNPGETMSTSTRFFSVGAPLSSVYNYSTGGGKVVAFSKKKGFLWDISYDVTGQGPEEFSQDGCCSWDAVTQCNGILLWMNNQGRIKAWGGNGLPSSASWEMEDDDDGEAILSNIADKSKVKAISVGNKFYFYLGTVTYKGQTIQHGMLKGLISQNNSVILYSIDSLPFEVGQLLTATFNGQEVMLIAESNSSNVYRYNQGNNDGDKAVTSFARTKFFDLQAVLSRKSLAQIVVLYKPQPNPGTYLKVSIATNGNYNYTPISNPDGVGDDKITRYGVIDMYNGGNEDLFEGIGVVNVPNEFFGRNMSVEVGNNQLDESYEISAIGFILSGIQEENLNVNTKLV